MRVLIELLVCILAVWIVLAISSYSMRVGFDPMGENIVGCRYWNGWEFKDALVLHDYCPFLSRTKDIAKCLAPAPGEQILDKNLRKCPL